MFLRFQKDILLWGSPKVIKAHLEFKNILDKPDGTKILVAANEMYKVMREDIGLSNSQLNNNELIKMFLLDPNELDIEMTKQKK